MASRFTTAGVAPPDAAASDGKVDLRGFLGLLRDRKRLIAIPTVLALAAAVLYLAVATRTYTGVTSLLIDARTRPAVGDTNQVLDNSPDAVMVESQVRLISSDSVLRRTVLAENLADDPEFAPTAPGLRTRLLRLVGLGGHAPSAPDRVTQAVLNLAAHVLVKRSERTYIADIEVTSVDPIKAAHLADAVASAYLADQQGTRNAAAERDSDWVRGQITQMQKGLQDAELKAEAYKRDHGIIGTNGKLLNEQELADASAGLSAAIGRATEIKARLDQIKKIAPAGRSIDSLPDALKSPLIDKLRGQYADISRQQATLRQTLGDRHPALIESEQQLRDLRRMISEELNRIQGGIANEYQTAQANVAALQAHVQALKDTTIASNEDRVRLDELQRDVDARRAVYDRFLRARDTVREQAVDAPIGRIIAPARIPTVPSSPRTFAILALSLTTGLGLGLALAFASDLAGTQRRGQAVPETPMEPLAPAAPPMPAIAAPREAEPQTRADDPAEKPGVPVLGYVPSPFGNPAALAARDGLLDRLRTAWPTAVEVEHVPSLPAFRTAVHAFALDHLAPARLDGMPRTVLVTSLGDPDSRTAFSLGLAEAAAGQGQRAIVIDADEDGSLLRELVTTSSRPILIDLMGTSRICYRVVAPFRGSLSIVPIAEGEAKLVRRLGLQTASARIDGLAANFDLIIFDGPRAGAASRLDAMAATVDAVIVTAPKTATQTSIDQAIEGLDLPQATPLSAILVADLAEGVSTSAAA